MFNLVAVGLFCQYRSQAIGWKYLPMRTLTSRRDYLLKDQAVEMFLTFVCILILLSCIY